jgi:hypothetical protein
MLADHVPAGQSKRGAEQYSLDTEMEFLFLWGTVYLEYMEWSYSRQGSHFPQNN